MNDFSNELAVLAATRSFLDVITPDLRAIVVSTNKKKEIFYIHIYYDGNVAENTIEDWNCAISEATASSSYSTDERVERIDYPHQIPVNGRLAYLRKEPYTPINCSILNRDLAVKRELINFKKPMGMYISPRELESFQTSWGIIHSIGQKSHIIPARPPSCGTDIYLEAYAIVSLQRALLGRVIPELRAVLAEVIKDSSHIFIRFYYEKPIEIAILDEWEFALSEVMADFGQGYSFDMAIELLPYPQKIPFKGRYAYLKKGGQIWDS